MIMSHTDLNSWSPRFPSVTLKTLQEQKWVSYNHSHLPPSVTGCYLLGVPWARDFLVARIHLACPATTILSIMSYTRSLGWYSVHLLTCSPGSPAMPSFPVFPGWPCPSDNIHHLWWPTLHLRYNSAQEMVFLTIKPGRPGGPWIPLRPSLPCCEQTCTNRSEPPEWWMATITTHTDWPTCCTEELPTIMTHW